ncbi:MAG: MFS transporter [Acidobacteriota bacterium]
MPASPYLALSLFYLTAFGVLGVYLPYFNLYLEELGLTAVQIGLVSALLPLSSAIVPTLGGLLSERVGRRRILVIVTTLLSFGACAMLLGVTGFTGIALAVGAFSILRAPSVPLVDATAMEISDAGGPDYGRMRVWGSLAFIVMALATGPVVGAWGERAVLHTMLAVLACGVGSTLLLPRDPAHRARAGPAGGLGRRIGEPHVLLFLAACVLSQASHGPYYVFFSIHLERAGYTPLAIGLLWAVAVGCEILVMLRMRRILDRVGPLPVIALSLVLAAARWAVCALTVHPLPIALSQTLHAASFAAFHVAAVTHTHRLFGERRRASGQAVYSSSTFGVGNILGMPLSGLFHDRLGVQGLFGWAGAVALVGAALTVAAARRRRSDDRGL